MKKFNFKAFFADHGEKVGFAFGVVMVLAVLGTSEWFPFDKAPEEIIKKANDAKDQIERNVWPEDSRTGFSIRDFASNTRELRGPLATTAYDYTTPLWHPLYRPQQLAKEPEFLAVIDLEAKAGTFVMAVAPKPTSLSPEDSTTTPATAAVAAVDDDDQFGLAQPSTTSPFGAGPGLAGASGTMADMMSAPPMPAAGYGSGGPAAGMMGTMGSMMMGDGYGVGEYGTAALTPGVTGRGERFISVRGVWPVYEQLKRYRQAMNLQTPNDARALLDITDFVLERKTAIAASDPWSGEWQTLDISRATEILSECPDFDIDIFDPRLVDVTITMPLPKRITGRWADYATHPQIKNFELKGPELERELKLQERLMKEYEKLNKLSQPTVTRGGFSGVQQNFRQMSDMIYSSPENTRSFDTSMRGFMENDNSMSMPGAKMSPPDIKARLTAAERLFLFRYFDFDIRPGYAYRYRVKLVLRNPNFQRPLDQVIDKSVAEGEKRETPWSTESTVAVVPETTNYFIRNVFRDPLHEAIRFASRAIANLKIYQWDQTVGTMIADTIEVKSIAQFIGEKKPKSLRLDVAKRSFKEDEVTFQTEDLYLDGLGDIRFSADEHKDLKLPAERKGMVGLIAEAVILNELGELETIKLGADPEREAEAQSWVDRERKPFEKYKGLEDKPMNPLDGGAYPGMMLEGETPGMFPGAPPTRGKGKGKGKANPRKMTMSPGMMSSGMMP